MTAADIDRCIDRFIQGLGRDAGRTPTGRYASFDYCFNYFQQFREKGQTASLASPGNMEASCLQLGFYLASWGMFRGSSDLLKRSVKHFEPVIELIACAEKDLWNIDAHGYRPDEIERLLKFGRKLRSTLGIEVTSDTLVTKIMLGVFGNVPAFDQFFRRGMNVCTFCESGLSKIAAFYRQHSEAIEWHRDRLLTLDFASGEPTDRHYTRSKVIDMIGFIHGGGTA